MGLLIINGGRVTTISSSNQYDGEKIGGELRNWTVYDADPNEFIKETYGDITQRCATLYHTSELARACINKPLSYVIGSGLAFRSAINAKYLGMSAQAAKEWSDRFTTLLHLEKAAVDYYGKQALLFREACRVGDAVLYFVREGDGRPFDIVVAGGPVAIDWEKDDHLYTLGIRLDKFSRRIGFWQKRSSSFLAFIDKAGDRNAIQFMLKEIPGQARGYPVLYSTIARHKMMDRVWDSTVARMVLESIMLGYFQTSQTDPSLQLKQLSRDSLGDRGKPDGSLDELKNSRDINPGAMFRLRNDEAMHFTDLKTPSNNFGTANEHALRLLAMARGYPPEFIKGEYSTSYTAHKGALNDAVRQWLYERERFIQVVEKKVHLEYLKHFHRTGQIELPPAFYTDYKVQEAFLEGTYLGPVPGHINPLQEVKADSEAVRQGFTTHSYVAQKYGNDWANMFDQWAEEQAKWYEASAETKAATMEQYDQEQMQEGSADGGDTA